MAEVDPDDDDVERHVLFWFRYDPERRQRRHVVIAAYDTDAELSAQMTALGRVLDARRASGAAEACEHLSGATKEPGYTARWNRRRTDQRLGRLDDDVAWFNFAPDDAPPWDPSGA